MRHTVSTVGHLASAMVGSATNANTSAPRHHPGGATSSLVTGEDGAADVAPHLLPSSAPVPLPIPSDDRPDEIVQQTYVAPSRDTVLTVRHQGLRGQDQEHANGALPRAEHAAEVARLTQELHYAKQAHVAEIAQLRAQHAADVQRLVQALWQAQDAARAASAPPDSAAGPPTPEPQPSSGTRPLRWRALLVRLPGQRALSFLARACALLRRNPSR